MDRLQPAHRGMGGPADGDLDRGLRLEIGSDQDPRRQISARLQVAALIYGVGFLLVFFTRILLAADFRHRDTFAVESIGVGLSVAVAAAVLLALRSNRLPPGRIVPLGLAFEVFGAAGVALVEQWGIFGSGPQARLYGISWLAVWIIVFPLVVPSGRRAALIAGLAAATTGPVAHLLSFSAGKTPSLPASLLGELFFPSYLAVLIAVYASGMMHRLQSDLQAARLMGCYELVEPLGRGGMGDVWLARHQFLSRPAAIKLIRTGESTASGERRAVIARRRFHLEAQAIAGLRSPHTVQLFDFGIAQDGRFYYVMELLEGLTLQELVDRHGPQPAGRVVHLLRQACRSLGEAHAGGLVHRDVKPANLMICRYGREVDFLKVLDFGIVKPSGSRPEALNLTTAGAFCGTPGFMAPEQVTGDGPLDARTDVYALGCVAFLLLCGRRVFAGDNPLQVLLQHAQREAPRPSACSELPVPACLDELVRRCLEREPERRPRDGDELGALLDACRADCRWSEQEAARWWTLHRPVAGAAVPPAQASGSSAVTTSFTP